MEQELITLLEHLSSSLVFRRVRVAQSLVFGVVVCRSLFVLFPVLSVLGFTNSDYPLVSSNSFYNQIQLGELLLVMNCSVNQGYKYIVHCR